MCIYQYKILPRIFEYYFTSILVTSEKQFVESNQIIASLFKKKCEPFNFFKNILDSFYLIFILGKKFKLKNLKQRFLKSRKKIYFEQKLLTKNCLYIDDLICQFFAKNPPTLFRKKRPTTVVLYHAKPFSPVTEEKATH